MAGDLQFGSVIGTGKIQLLMGDDAVHQHVEARPNRHCDDHAVARL